MRAVSKKRRPANQNLFDGDIDSFIEATTSVMRQENALVHALITQTPGVARRDLRRVAVARRAGSPLPLDGMTIAVKDNIDIDGVLGTVGSPWFAERTPGRDAVVVDKLRRSGGVVLATANLHELAYGGTSSNPHFGAVRNPWALNRIPGGSSGGSAVAVACDWVTVALGTDTGGSVRCPASMTGITGLRPTYGMVTTEGVVPLAESFDTVGFMARDVLDIEQVLIAVSDEKTIDICYDGRPLRIGLPGNTYFAGVSDSIARAISEVADVFTKLGHEVVPVQVPEPAKCDEVARLIVRREAFMLYEELLSHARDRIGVDVASRLELGADISESTLIDLREQRKELTRGLDMLLSEVDVLLMPTIPVGPAVIGSDEMLTVTERSLRFTYLWGVAGLPALSFPGGFDQNDLPIGAQVVAARGRDRMLCGLAAQYQSVTDWNQRRPPRPFRSR